MELVDLLFPVTSYGTVWFGRWVLESELELADCLFRVSSYGTVWFGNRVPGSETYSVVDCG